MLHKETVDHELLKLTCELLKQPALEKFVLVGGTALSLQIGHRRSIDIDLFSSTPFNVEEMVSFLQNEFDFSNQNQFKNSLLGSIRNIKVDIISHQYAWLKPALEEDGLRMAGLEDIAAMKLNAIVGNGSRLKDFVDIAYLTSRFSLQQMLQFYETKYPLNNSMMAIKSLNWFDDINFDVDIQYTNNSISWTLIKSRIIEMIQQPQQLFAAL